MCKRLNFSQLARQYEYVRQYGLPIASLGIAFMLAATFGDFVPSIMLHIAGVIAIGVALWALVVTLLMIVSLYRWIDE